MGLIKVAVGSAVSVAAEQWKEFFYCDAFDSETIVAKGYKRNMLGEVIPDSLLSNGSLLIVGENQAMMLVEEGRITDFSAEPGAYVLDTSKEPTLFPGALGNPVKESFDAYKHRFVVSFDASADMRVIYVNLSDLPGNKFGTPEAISYYDLTHRSVMLRFFGSASIRIIDPIRFFVNESGNVDRFGLYELWDGRLKFELITSLPHGLKLLSNENIGFDSIPVNSGRLTVHINTILKEDWFVKRGIIVGYISIPNVSLDSAEKKRSEYGGADSLVSDGDFLTSADVYNNDISESEAYTLTSLLGSLSNAELSGEKLSLTDLYNAIQYQGDKRASPGTRDELVDLRIAPAISIPEHQIPKVEVKPNLLMLAGDREEWECSCGTVNSGKYCCECGKQKQFML